MKKLRSLSIIMQKFSLSLFFAFIQHESLIETLTLFSSFVFLLLLFCYHYYLPQPKPPPPPPLLIPFILILVVVHNMLQHK